MDKRKNSSDVRTRQALLAFHPNLQFWSHDEYAKEKPPPSEQIIKLEHIRILENTSLKS